jgi:CheY-like chemotaxis protein
MRSWLGAVLRPLAAAIVEAGSGWEVLHLVANDGPFDLVVSDVRMPAPNGLTVVTMSRAAGLRTPFLIITAFPDRELRRALAAVEDAWLMEKPFDGKDFLAMVAGILRSGPRQAEGV